MAMSGGNDDGEPMMEMNTTPLIDVMLVLLIMFIITIPIATHAVNIPLPINSDAPPPDVDPIKNKVVVNVQNEILWNGNSIDQATLQGLLSESLRFTVEPELQFQPEPRARYELVDQVLAVISNSGVNKFGFVGNEQYRDFGAPPVVGG